MMEREDRSAEESLRLHVKTERQNLDFVFKHKMPTLFVSYEKLLVNPDETILDLAQFLGFSATPRKIRQINSFIHPGRYEPVDTIGKARNFLNQLLGRTSNTV